LSHFYERIVAVMDGLSEPFELLLVNDGSRDSSFKIMRELHKQDPRVRVIDFSRNFGHQIAISAGLDMHKVRLSSLLILICRTAGGNPAPD